LPFTANIVTNRHIKEAFAECLRRMGEATERVSERGEGERCESAAFILCVTARFMFMCVLRLKFYADIH